MILPYKIDRKQMLQFLYFCLLPWLSLIHYISQANFKELWVIAPDIHANL